MLLHIHFSSILTLYQYLHIHVLNIVASNDSNRIFILVSAEIAPVDPGFIPLDLDNLYKAAIDAGATPYYASVSLGSADEQHFSDGIIMYGDAVRFRINAFAELETE